MVKQNNVLAGHKAELTKHKGLLKGQLDSYKVQKLEELKSDISYIKSYYSKLVDGSDEEEPIEEEIQGFKDKYSEIEDYYKKLLATDIEIDDEEKQLSIKEKIDNFKKEIEEYKNLLLEGHEGKKSIKSQINKTHSEIKEYHDEIFGKEIVETSDDGEDKIKKIEGLKDKFDSLYNNNEKRLLELTKQIKSALPDATTAGLASAYSKNRKRFLLYNILWGFIFFVSIIILVFLFFLTVIDFKGISFADNKNIILEILINIKITSVEGLESMLSSTLALLPLYGPFVWLAYHASKEQSKNKRLEQEYLHKESVMKTFTGYSNAIKELGEGHNGEEIKKQLLATMIEMVSYNPSNSLDKKHGTKHPVSGAIDLLKIETIIGKENFHKIKNYLNLTK